MNKKVLVILAALMLFASVSAFAQGAGTTTTTTTAAANPVRWGVIAAAFVLGLAAAAGAIGQSRAIAAAASFSRSR